MKLTKIQRALLEEIWVEMNEIPLQLVSDILGKNNRLHPKKVNPTKNGKHAIELRKLLPIKLLDHLLKIKTQSAIKIEN